MHKTVKSKIKVFLITLFALALTASLFSCKKKNQNLQTEAPQTQELQTQELQPQNENTFYSPAEDDASWVESLLARIEEERIAEELASMEASVSEYQLEEETFDEEKKSDSASSDNSPADNSPEENPPEEISPIEKFFEEAKEGKSLTGKNNQLRFFEFENEILSPQQTENGLVVVHSTDSNISRIFYDEKYNMVKREEWNIKSAADAKLLKTEAFSYSEETGKVLQKDITSQTDFESITYNEASSPVSAKKYTISDDKKYITMERNWVYDEKNQLIKDEQKEYLYKNKDFNTKPEIFSKRYEYTYYDIETEGEEDKNEIPPDSKYYENDVLKMKYNYTAEKGSWYTWIYFDDLLSVKTYYEKEVRVYDEYYNAGKLMRKKVYDKVD